MIVTEEEAKTRWCPFASARLIEWKASSTEIRNQIYATAGNEPVPICIGSQCMAWRKTVEIWEEREPPPEKQGWVNRGDEWQPFERSGGYCGLAGKP